MASTAVDDAPSSHEDAIDFRVDPASYRHLHLRCEGPVATIELDIDEDAGLRSGYKLKLNSYDLGVDIELADALQRIRFEHPEVRAVVIASTRERVFCSGANIFMLGLSSHAWKVNFCKFTNETRNGIEDASRHSGLKFIAACKGTTAGGGYELALACDEIVLVDDRSSAVSLPEVPVLGVLPGTGGLTRLTDKRKVRSDLVDVFCTTAEGVRGLRARDWGLVDHLVKPAEFAARVTARALELAAHSDRPGNAAGIALTPLERAGDGAHYRYAFVEVLLDPPRRHATIVVEAPAAPQPSTLAGIREVGAAWWPLQMARELDDAIVTLRTNHPELGLWVLRTRGDAGHVLAVDAALREHAGDWFVRETIGMLRRTLARLDVTSRTLFALIDEGSCFAGTLLELALGADRAYMLASGEAAPAIVVSAQNFGAYPRLDGVSRLASRFRGVPGSLVAIEAALGERLDAARALELGLVTAAPDDLDWKDEVRLAIEERVSLSPDALTGLEANLRFNGAETMETRIFGRLSAWQNWIFARPNAVGPFGALKVFGSGQKARFDPDRV